MKSNLYFICILYCLSAIVYCNVRTPGKLTNEKKLIKNLKESYPVRWSRPIVDGSNQTTLVVSFGITLIQILDLDASNQALVTNIWSKYTWNDPYLSWDPSKYGGLKTVRMPSSDVFTPDIVLFNNADTRLEDKRDALVVIYHEGEILWIPPSIFRSTCAIDTKYFPFDLQNCSMKFGSWTYETDQLDLEFVDNRAAVDLAEYTPSNEWQILDAPAVKHTKIYDSKTYTDLTFYIILKRNGGFYSYILILPCVLLAFLTMVVFWLPPETPAKMILGMNIFVAFFLLLLLLAELVPQASNEVPVIGIYYCLNMVMIALSAFLCTIVIHLFWRADQFCKVPPIIRTIFLDGLARAYCMLPKTHITNRNLLASGLLNSGKNVIHGDKFEKFELLKERFKSYRENMVKMGFENLLETSKPTINNGICSETGLNEFDRNCICPYCAYCTKQQAILTEISNLNVIEADIKEIRDYLRDTRKKLEAREYKTKMAQEWKLIALVLDRTFFFIFLFVTIITLVLMFPRNSFTKTTNSDVNKVATAVVDASGGAGNMKVPDFVSTTVVSSTTQKKVDGAGGGGFTNLKNLLKFY